MKCLESNKPLTADLWQAFAEAGITEVDVFFPERDDIGLVLSRTLDKDSIRSSKEALIEIYRKLRPGDPPTLETATNLFRGMFFDPRKYDFSRVGRLKFNIKMGLDTPLDNRTWTPPTSFRPSSTCSSCARTSASSTISITLATAAFARLVSSLKTSSASALSAWNAPLRKR